MIKSRIYKNLFELFCEGCEFHIKCMRKVCKTVEQHQRQYLSECQDNLNKEKIGKVGMIIEIVSHIISF